MIFSRLLALSTLTAAALAQPAFAADTTTRLLQSVPAGTPLVVHVRSVSDIRADFARSPYGRMWAEPEVQGFFAPTVAFLNSPDAQEAFGKFENLTGLTMLDFFNLFSGEVVIAVTMTTGPDGEPAPQVIIGGALGANRGKLEAALEKVRASSEVEAVGTISEEEFQGETICTFVKKPGEDEEPEETISWALVDDVIWQGYPKSAVQGAVANLKRGGAENPITASEGFGPVYQRNAGADAAYYLDVQSLVQFGMTVYKSIEAKKQQVAEANAGAAEGEETEAKPSMFEQMGLTPEVIVHALGLDAIRGLYAVSASDEETLAMTAGITWTEQRGILKMLAYGDAPAPQPAFVAPTWASVTAVRFKVSDIWEAVKETVRTANPQFEFILAQQLEGLKQQVGIDVERDVWGSFGDEIVRAYQFNSADPTSTEGNEQLWAISLANAEAFGRALEVAFAMAGPQVGQMFQDREYLGQTIRSITAPIPSPGASQPQLTTIAYAVTPTYLFLDIGGSQMIETAVQRLGGEGASYWTQAPVVAAMKDLPAGGSSFTLQDIKQVVHGAFVQLANVARVSSAATGGDSEGEEDVELNEDGQTVVRPGAADKAKPGLHAFIDPDSVPSLETLAKYFGVSYGAIYRDADGLRFHARYKNVP